MMKKAEQEERQLYEQTERKMKIIEASNKKKE
jgi:hypothetical protein